MDYMLYVFTPVLLIGIAIYGARKLTKEFGLHTRASILVYFFWFFGMVIVYYAALSVKYGGPIMLARLISINLFKFFRAVF